MSGFLLDSYPSGATIYAAFHTYDSNGASITLTGLLTSDIEIYKNGSTTQRASDAGFALLDTDGIDFDGITGIHGISIDLADNTDAGFFAAGSQYTVVLASVTIDTRTVNLVLGTFRIAPAEHTAGYPVVTIKDGTGTGELDTASGVVLAKDHTGANLATAAALDTVDDFLDTEVAAIKAKTDSLTFTVAGKVDANPTAINGDATAAANLAKTTRAIGRGTVDAGASTTSIPTSAFTPAGGATDQFKGRIITFDADTTTAALRGQATDITASSNAAAPTFTVTALTSTPASGDTFSVT